MGKRIRITLGGQTFETKKAALEHHAELMKRWKRPCPLESDVLTGADEAFARGMALNCERAQEQARAGWPITVGWHEYQGRPPEAVLRIGGERKGATFFGKQYVWKTGSTMSTGDKLDKLRNALFRGGGMSMRGSASHHECAEQGCGNTAAEWDHVDPSFNEIARRFLTEHDVRFLNTPERGRELAPELVPVWIEFHDAAAWWIEPVCRACHTARGFARRLG